ncbi:MAG: biopolymer transporter ExbD [bacterium]
MSAPDLKPMAWRVAGFSRYQPANCIGGALATIAPWVSVTLLIVFYLGLSQAFVLQPGICVELPAAPFTGGTRYGHDMVVLAPEPQAGKPREELVFFDDQRFMVREAAQMDALRAALARATHERPAQAVVIEADAAVRHGTTVRLLNMAQEAGSREVHLATRPK